MVEQPKKMCTNKPLVKGPWYRWAFECIRHDRFGIRNRVERFFRYLKEIRYFTIS
jgi:hypothetical protein